MPLSTTLNDGNFTVEINAIEAIAGYAALDCYGLVGMASRKQLKDGLAELLGRDNPGRGVVARLEPDGLQLDLYVIVGYGIRISEVAANIQQKVKYVLNDVTGLDVQEVNVFVQGVRLTR